MAAPQCTAANQPTGHQRETAPCPGPLPLPRTPTRLQELETLLLGAVKVLRRRRQAPLEVLFGAGGVGALARSARRQQRPQLRVQAAHQACRGGAQRAGTETEACGEPGQAAGLGGGRSCRRQDWRRQAAGIMATRCNSPHGCPAAAPSQMSRNSGGSASGAACEGSAAVQRGGRQAVGRCAAVAGQRRLRLRSSSQPAKQPAADRGRQPALRSHRRRPRRSSRRRARRGWRGCRRATAGAPPTGRR